MQDTTSIKDSIYPAVETALKNNTNLNNWRRFISKFMQTRQKELFSNMPSKQMYYSENDVQEFFKSTGIDRKIVKEGIKNTYYFKMANFNPSYAKDESTVALLCMVKYFKDNKDDKNLELALINMSFSGKYYPSIFFKHYRFEPAEYVMEYVITHMLSQKYDIIKYGNVIGAIKSVSKTWHETYNSRFNSFHDEDCTYLIQQLHNRIDSFISNIADLYYKAYEDKDIISYDTDDMSDDNYHIADNDSYKVERITQATMKTINTKGINYRNCKISSNDNVKFDELKSIIEMLVNNDSNQPLIKEYISILITLYFVQTKNREVKHTDFIIFAVKPTPNAKNKYVKRRKELLDQILINNSEYFMRRRARPATEAAYYRAVNTYFALTIQDSI